MKTISYQVSDAIATELVNAMAARYGYTTTVPDPVNQGQTIPNPETKQQFALRMGWEVLKAELMAYRERVAEQTKDTSAANATPSIA